MVNEEVRLKTSSEEHNLILVVLSMSFASPPHRRGASGDGHIEKTHVRGSSASGDEDTIAADEEDESWWHRLIEAAALRHVWPEDGEANDEG
ncbi:Os03g0287300 [Oryza sativa Japonica Group]|jgi:hypothetical protein|uniref:Os03g0287300 protein n=1 Tax=Oryza sativa subsp. japonica TaxID=39947 RepID=A0A0P0VWW9_ORYSJ|nr:Os03g0287300 [Oryza sativa Japonica Group]